MRPKIKELQTIQRQEKNEAENQGITDNTAPREKSGRKSRNYRQYSAKRKMRPKIKELQTIQRQEKNEAENQGITDNTAPREK